MSKYLNMNSVDFAKVLYYDETSPSGLRWISNRNNITLKGEVAGSKMNSGKFQYYRVDFNYTKYLAHRIIMVLKGHSLIEDDQIDHIDGNPLNNKYKNLRIVKAELNSTNKAKYVNNISGITGVYFHTTHNLFVGSYHDGTSRRTKSFSIGKYGQELALQLAIEFRNNGISSMKDRYTERHGK